MFTEIKREKRELLAGPAQTALLSNYSGRSVNERTALRHSVVWSAVTLIADSISSLPLEARRESTPDSDQLQRVPLPAWLRSPHPELLRSDVISQLLVSMLLWGDGFAYLLRRESDAQITGLQPIPPDQMYVEWDKLHPGRRRYRVGAGEWLSSLEILHVQGPTLPGEARGLSVIAQAKEAVSLGLTLEEFGSRFFGQGSQAKVVLEVPRVVDEKQARQLVDTYERFHKGRGNWHRPAVMSGGAKLHNIQINPDDSQFLQTREFQNEDIARWFRIPGHRLGLGKTSGWGSGLSEENLAMMQFTFKPWITRLENAFTARVPGGEDRRVLIRFNTTDLERGSFNSQVDAWSIAVKSKLATPNEARKALGLPKIKGGDELVSFTAPVTDGKAKEDDKARKQDDAKEADRSDIWMETMRR